MVSMPMSGFFSLFKDTDFIMLFFLMFLNTFQTQHKGDRVNFGSGFESIIHHHSGDSMASRQALAMVLGVRQLIILNLQSETREINARTQVFFCSLPFIQSGSQPRDGDTHIQGGFFLHLKPPRNLRTERARCVSPM